MAERMSTDHALHQIVVFGLSDRGLQRDNNEDHFMVADLGRKVIGVHDNQLRPELFQHDIGTRGTLLLVADGLGGLRRARGALLHVAAAPRLAHLQRGGGKEPGGDEVEPGHGK